MRNDLPLPLTTASRFRLLVIFLLSIGGLNSCTPEGASTSRAGGLRVLTYNVWYGFTKKPERKPEWLAWMQAQQPDIVCLQELNEYTPDQLQQDAATWEHPYSVLLKEEGFPTGITSRYPLEEVKKTLEGFHHGLIRARIQGLYVYCVHLHPSNWKVRIREIDQILADIATLPAGAPVIVAGDFNTFSPLDADQYAHGLLEPFFTRLDSLNPAARNLREGRLDYTPLTRLIEQGFTDLEYSLRPDDYVFTGSFPGLIVQEEDHGSLRRLDYIFVNEPLLSGVRRALVIANDTTQLLSDHLPMVAEWEK